MKYILISILTLITLSAKSREVERTFSFSDVRVEIEKDSVFIELAIRVPRGGLHSCEGWQLTPFIQTEERSIPLPSITITDKKRARLNNRSHLLSKTSAASPLSYAVKRRKESVIIYRAVIPYEEGIEEGEFSLEGLLTRCGGRKLLSQMALRREESPQHERYYPAIHVNYIEPALSLKERSESGEAHITFETGKTLLKEEYGRNREELAEIESTLKKIEGSRDMELRRIALEGYASPEGSWKRNKELSEKRVKSVESYLERRHRISSSLFQREGVGEDWQGLRELIEEGNLRDKKEILAIIDSGASPDEKERRLRQMGPVWYILLYDYFPRLRRVRYEITYKIREFETGELAGRFIEDPTLLSPLEFFRMAEDYGIDSEEWHLMLQMAAGLYPDDPVVLINAAASLLVQGEILEAGELLKEVIDDRRAYNNIGAFYLLAGDTLRAERYLRLSVGVKGTEMNLRELEKVRREKRKVKGEY